MAKTTFVGSYQALKQQLRNRPVATIGNNTVARETADGGIAVELHGHTIYLVSPSGKVRVRDGGYQTVTTKSRLNDLLRHVGVYVYQKNYTWFIRATNGEFEFRSGLELDAEGNLVGQDAVKVA